MYTPPITKIDTHFGKEMVIRAGRGARHDARRLARANPKVVVTVKDRKGTTHYSALARWLGEVETFAFMSSGQAMSGKTHFVAEMFMPRCVLTLRNGSASAEALLDLYADTEARKEFPITVTTKRRAPKQRRHTRGGLRKMVAARVHRFTAHGISVSTVGGERGKDAPWTFTMPVTKAHA